MAIFTASTVPDCVGSVTGAPVGAPIFSFIINNIPKLRNREREVMRPGWHEACMEELNRVIQH
jgi:hypothetical protein